ncbi:MAG: DUF3842 family protein [Clostridiales bacterium]|nr:DUF3842 family protein [Clostridiales bacterium]
MNILIVDGQGGGIGRQLIEALRERLPELEITAVGTNAFATSAMLKAGAKRAATGENAAIVATRTADVIAGPVGIVIADALMGEVTPAMAVAVAQSRARKVLIPVNQCDNFVVGVPELSTTMLVGQAVEKILG